MSGDEKRRRLEREAKTGDGQALERLAEDDARRTGAPPMVRMRAETWDAVRAAAKKAKVDERELVHTSIEAGLRCTRDEHVARMAGERRTAREALALATLALCTASPDQARAVQTVLEKGAGHLPLEGATYSSPAGLVPERREAWIAVSDAIRLDSVGLDQPWSHDAIWRPVHAGEWESVLATLLVERNWEEIERTARELERPEKPRARRGKA